MRAPFRVAPDLRDAPSWRRFAFLVLLTLVAPAPADAVVAPVQRVDGHWFPVETAELQVELAAIALVETRSAESVRRWEVDAELWIRNVGLDAERFDLAAVAGDVVGLWVDGSPVDPETVDIRQDPNLVDATFGAGALIPITLPPESTVVVHVRSVLDGRTDAYGRPFVIVPTHALGLFEGTVRGGRLEAWLLERPYGLRSTLQPATVYDEPTNRVSWPLRMWEAALPFQLAYLPPWSALLAMAEVERCPDPWEVMRTMSAGDIEGIQRLLAAFDDAALGFCAHLPLVAHGHVFQSERVRSQLGDVGLDRYVPDADAGARAYVPNPAFEESMLNDGERIYRNALERFAPPSEPAVEFEVP